MAYRRCRSSIYVSTNPNLTIDIGTPGVSVFIGTPGPTIYGQSEQIVGYGLVTESAAADIEIESSTDTLIVEGV